jgi:hypothetical protein
LHFLLVKIFNVLIEQGVRAAALPMQPFRLLGNQLKLLACGGGEK